MREEGGNGENVNTCACVRAARASKKRSRNLIYTRPNAPEVVATQGILTAKDAAVLEQVRHDHLGASSPRPFGKKKNTTDH